jgi:hypothetical protein
MKLAKKSRYLWNKQVKTKGEYLLRYSTTPLGLVSSLTSSLVLRISKELRKATVSISKGDRRAVSGPLTSLGFEDQ